jgi:hypothetical protein
MTLKKVQCTLTLGLVLLAANSYAQTVPAGYASTCVTNTLPAKSPAVVADDSIRPFHVNVPEEELVATIPFLDSSRIADHATPRMCRERTTFLRLFPSAVRRCGLRRRNLILEVVRIETVEAAVGGFRLRIHEECDWRAVRPGQSDVVREVVGYPVHLPGPE